MTRPLVPAEGLLLLEGLLLTVGRLELTRAEVLPTRAEAKLPLTCGRPDMLPPLVRAERRLLDNTLLMEPPWLLACLTLAT